MSATETDIQIIYQNQSASTVQYLLASLEDANITTVELAERHIELTEMLTEGALEAIDRLAKQFGASSGAKSGKARGGSSGGRSYSGGSSKRASGSSSSDDKATDKQVAFAIRLLEEAGEDADRVELEGMGKKEISLLIEELKG